MDLDVVASKALYGRGGRALLEEAAMRGLDFEALEKLGRDKVMRVLVDAGADGNPALEDEGYLVVTARNAMRDALRRMRDVDLGRRGFSILDWNLNDRLRFDPPGNDHNAAWNKRLRVLRGLVPQYNWGFTQSTEDTLGVLEDPGIGGRMATQTNRSYNPRREPKRRPDLSDEGYREANELLTPKERRVVDGVLAGKTQTEIAADLGHEQPWISKMFRRSIRKLVESESAELRALGGRLMLLGRETRRAAV